MNVIEIDADMVQTTPPEDGKVTLTIAYNHRLTGEMKGDTPIGEFDFVQVRLDAELARTLGTTLAGS